MSKTAGSLMEALCHGHEFYNGKACPECGSAKRRTSDRQCPPCALTKSRQDPDARERTNEHERRRKRERSSGLPGKIVDEALLAAAEAGASKALEIGQRDCCGFAEAVIRPARGSIVSELRRRGVGASWESVGFCVSSSDLWREATQSISAKESAVYAFVSVLKRHGVDADMQSRMD